MSAGAASGFASVVLDVDSTLCGVEGIDWLAGLRGSDVGAQVTALTDRAMRGRIALDAVYGEMDKFASWIESHRSGFFVSSYTHYTARRDRELMSMLKQKGIGVS